MFNCIVVYILSYNMNLWPLWATTSVPGCLQLLQTCTSSKSFPCSFGKFSISIVTHWMCCHVHTPSIHSTVFMFACYVKILSLTGGIISGMCKIHFGSQKLVQAWSWCRLWTKLWCLNDCFLLLVFDAAVYICFVNLFGHLNMKMWKLHIIIIWSHYCLNCINV